MGQKSGPVKEPAEQVVKEIRRATRRQFSAEEKIRIVLSGLRGEDSIAELCRREAGDYPAGRALAAAGAPYPGETRHSAGHLLPLVRPIQPGRAGSLERSPAPAGPHLEPHSGRGARKHHPAGARRAGALATRAGGALHRQPGLFRLGGHGYRLLKARDLIASPAFIVIKAADAFKDKTTAPNQLWQTDFTYLK